MFGSNAYNLGPSEGSGSGIRLAVDMSDAELAHALRKRHPDALPLAMARFDRVVRAMLWQAFRCSDEWRDARQEVFLCLFRDIASLREPSLLRAFVIGITKNIVRAEIRRRQVRALARLEPDCASLEVAGVPNRAVADHDLKRLQVLLRRLRRRERTTFVLRFVERMSVLEIAAVLGLSNSTVQRSLRKGWSRVASWAARDPFLIDYLPEDSVKVGASRAAARAKARAVAACSN